MISTQDFVVAVVRRETGADLDMIRSRQLAKNVVMARRLMVWAYRECLNMTFAKISLEVYGRNRPDLVADQYRAATMLLSEGDAVFLAATQRIGADVAGLVQAKTPEVSKS